MLWRHHRRVARSAREMLQSVPLPFLASSPRPAVTGAESERIAMTTLLIAVGTLFVAVIGWTLLDPWASPATRKPKDQADEERARMMETIALSFF